MIMGFDAMFVPLVERRLKKHSIRAGNRWRVGMLIHLYAAPRQKGMRLIGLAKVRMIEPISIACDLEKRPEGWPSAKVAPLAAKTTVTIGGHVLTNDELNVFAFADGFQSAGVAGAFRLMVEYWRRKNGLGTKLKCFTGQVVHWGELRTK